MDKNMDVNKKYDNSKNISNEEMIQKIKKHEQQYLYQVQAQIYSQ